MGEVGYKFCRRCKTIFKQNLTKAAAALLKPMQPFSAMWAANRVTNPVNPYAALGNQFTNNVNEEKGLFKIVASNWPFRDFFHRIIRRSF